MKLLKAFIGHINHIQPLKTSALRHSRRKRHYQITMDWNGGLANARHHHVHPVFSAHDTYTTDLFLKVWHDCIAKCIFNSDNTYCLLIIQTFLLHARLYKMQRVNFLNAILNEWEVKLENTYFVKKKSVATQSIISRANMNYLNHQIF